ncbi:hypothetical protein DEA98_28595 (plasmid) [Brucella pseudogrignonensis]|nr:hypothetical protein [Brucella pseudogrignonensis]
MDFLYLRVIAINTVTDSKSLNDDDLRRIWFFMDEWAQLPHINQFQTFTVGRSKGICVVLGLQDAAQVSEKYGQDALKTLMASVGTTIIVQVNHGETALTLERYFGKPVILNGSANLLELWAVCNGSITAWKKRRFALLNLAPCSEPISTALDAWYLVWASIYIRSSYRLKPHSLIRHAIRQYRLNGRRHSRLTASSRPMKKLPPISMALKVARKQI